MAPKSHVLKTVWIALSRDFEQRTGRRRHRRNRGSASFLEPPSPCSGGLAALSEEGLVTAEGIGRGRRLPCRALRPTPSRRRYPAVAGRRARASTGPAGRWPGGRRSATSDPVSRRLSAQPNVLPGSSEPPATWRSWAKFREKMRPAGTYARRHPRPPADRSGLELEPARGQYVLAARDRPACLQLGEEADGKSTLEAQMILNHKAAIEFLVDNAEEIGFNRYSILNLHALLADNLLRGPRSPPAGSAKLRWGSAARFTCPPPCPQLIEECFPEILEKASAIADPFEQAFFVMVHLPYLQPFEDVNKRVSRLAANIPLVRAQPLPDLLRRRAGICLCRRAARGLRARTGSELLREALHLGLREIQRPLFGGARGISASPTPSGCDCRILRSPKWSPLWCAAGWTRRPPLQPSTLPASKGGAPSDRPALHRGGRNRGDELCTKATSRATASGLPNSRPGQAGLA